MRMARYKIGELGSYYVRSRLRPEMAGWGERECAGALALMRRVADFSGVQLVDAVVLPREIQLLVRLDPREEVPDEELVRRYRVLMEGEEVGYLGYDGDRLAELLAAGGEGAEKLRVRLRSRMQDLSAFMKTLKQRLTMSYNRRHGRIGGGSLWRDRFESTLVQERASIYGVYREHVQTAPARAGLVEEASAYPHAYRMEDEPTAYEEQRVWRRKRAARWDPVARVADSMIPPYLSLRGGRPPLPEWDEWLARAVVAGTASFVRKHARRWRKQGKTTALAETEDATELRAARPHRCGTGAEGPSFGPG